MPVSRTRRALVSAAVLALPIGLLASAPASAGATVPLFSYVYVGGAYSTALTSAAADGGSPVPLMPPGYQVWDHDVTQDGQTELLAVEGCSGKECSGDLPGLRTTDALLLVHHDPGYGTRARILTTYWDSGLALTADGSPVWSAIGTVYRISGIDYSTAAWADPALTPTLGTVSSTRVFDPSSLPTDGSAVWDTSALAVSPDGNRVAVLQTDGVSPVPDSRILAAGFASGAAPGATYFSQSWTSSGGVQPDPGLLTFLDDAGSRLAFQTSRPADPPIISTTDGEKESFETGYVAALSVGGSAAATQASALDNVYSLRQLGSTWWGWKDSAGAGNTTIVSSYGSSDSPDTVAIAPLTPRADGSVTWGYQPTTARPPVLTPSMVVRRLTGTPVLTMKAASVGYGKRNTFWSEYRYEKDSSQAGAQTGLVRGVQKGVLYFSIDGGRSWRTVATPGSTVLVNGYQPWSLTPKLYRTTWFRWSYAGDMLTAPAATSPRHPVIVTVAPPITVTVARSGANRTVHGLARRSGGRIVLLHKVGPRFRLVATASLSSKGAFSFGRRHLASGRYEVVAVGDASWGASTKVFTI